MADMKRPANMSRIRSFFERWERLETQRRELSDDLKELFSEAKGEGFNSKALRAAFAEKFRAENEPSIKAEKRQMDEADADLYLAALAGPSHACEASQSYAEQKGVQFVGISNKLSTAPKSSNSNASSAETVDLGTTPHDPETGGIEQEPCDCSEHAKPGEYYHCPKCDAEWFPEDAGEITEHEQPETARNEPEAAAEVAGDYLREPVAAEQGQIIREGDAPRETDRFGGDASCPDTELPETATQSGLTDEVRADASSLLPSSAGTAGKVCHSPAGSGSDEMPATTPNPPAQPSQALADKTETVSSRSVSIALSDDDFDPSKLFLNRDRKPEGPTPEMIRRLRPGCAHADDLSRCAGRGKILCNDCKKALAASEAEVA